MAHPQLSPCRSSNDSSVNFCIQNHPAKMPQIDGCCVSLCDTHDSSFKGKNAMKSIENTISSVPNSQVQAIHRKLDNFSHVQLVTRELSIH